MSDVKAAITKLLAAYNGGKVSRFHVEYTVRTHSVAAHSWGVAMLLSVLNPGCNANLLRAALFHDVGEVRSGDVPFWAKRDSPVLKEAARSQEAKYLRQYGFEAEQELSSKDLGWLHACDLLEACFSMIVEVQLGNRYLAEDLVRALGNFLHPPAAWPKLAVEVGLELYARLAFDSKWSEVEVIK